MWADWHTLLSFLGAIQGLILATFLFFNGKNGSTTKYLSVFTLVFSVGLLERVIAPFKESILFFWLPDLVGITSFLYGPLFYLYVFKSLNASKKVVVHKHLLVFYAFSIELLIVSVLRQLFDYQLSEYFTQVQELISFQLLFAQLFYYGYKSFLLLRSEKHPQSFLKWLFYLTSSLMVIYIISYISTTLLLLGFHFGKPLMVFVQFGCVAVVYSFSYHALLQKNQINQQLDTPPKYNNSPIISENKPEYLRRIVDSMEKDHLFLDPLLTLNKLSDKLDINRFYVSQVINEELVTIQYYLKDEYFSRKFWNI